MADIRIRQGVHNLDDAHVADFRNSYRQMMAISDNRGYQFLAGLHGVPGYYCWHHQHNYRAAQNMQLFCPGTAPISTIGRWRCATASQE